MRYAVLVLLMMVSLAAAADVQPPRRLAHFDMMPRLAALPDGTLAAYFIEVRGPGLAPTPPVQHMLCRISRDHGKTWSEPETLFTFPKEEGGFGFHGTLVDQQGEVHFLVMNDNNTGMLRYREVKPGQTAVEPRDKQRLDICHIRSSDGRTKWSKPKKIWEGRVSDLQSVLQLKSGRIILPFGDTVRGRNWSNRGEGFAAFTFFGEFDTHVLYSDDNGDTWKKSESILRTPTPNNFGSFGAVEPVLMQLKDGRVWMLLRTQLGRLWESYSDDGSVWSDPKPTAITSSDAPAGLVRLKDDRLVLLWNNCQRFPYARGGRQVLHAAVSDDDGKTWRGKREVLRDPLRNDPPPVTGDHGVSYTYPIVGHDGRVLYTMWVQTGEGRSIESFDPDWVVQTSAKDDLSGLDAWSVFGTKGAETDGNTLSLRKADAAWPAGGATWNFPLARSGSIKMRVQADKDFGDKGGGALLMLTDHFSPAFDLEDRYYSLFNTPLDLEPGKWTDLELRWNGDKQTCDVILDGKPVKTLQQQRDSDGPTYLRVRCTSDNPSPARLQIDAVEMTASPG